MSVLLAGKPELSVGFLRHKILADQRNANKWDSRYCTASVKSEPEETASSPSPTGAKNQNCGMCARSQTATTTCAMTTATTTVTTTDVQRTSQEPSSVNEPADRGVSATIMDVAIRCTSPGCTCEGFAPSKPQIRSCDNCQHGWVAHAMDKLGFRHLFNCHSVEMVQATSAFDVASLMLYGTEALPIRLKILLDRLFSVLQREEVIHVLHGFGWTYEDYSRGYILQDVRGQVLEKWTMPSREEEPLILQQFLRFGETKQVAQQLLLQDAIDRTDNVIHPARDYSESDIKRFIQRTCRATSSTVITPTSSSTPQSLKTTTTAPVMAPTANSLTTTPSGTAPSGGMSAQVTRVSRPPSNVSSTTSPSPTTASPMNSPLSSSPLNKLQNMQPYDFRRERSSPDFRNQGLPILNFAHQGTPLTSPTATMANANYSLVSNAVSSSFMSSNSSNRFSMTSDISMSATDEGSGNDTDSGAINLSQHHDITVGHPHLDSIFAAKKIRHLRKSANPMKRRWNPMMLSAMTTNPTTGKKRVQCHVCLKTFCDKGALKIHFSAVHLREMHKCTVDGCNMMFSSRRSRNRHSANPNPKLHTPNLRRKISHHDGRSSLPYPMIPSSTLINFNNGSAAGIMGLPPVMHAMPPSEQDASGRMQHSSEPPSKLDNALPSSTVDDSPPDAGKSGHQPLSTQTSVDEVLQLTKKQRLELNGDTSNDGDEGIDLSVKDDRGQIDSLNKGVRKRKSFNPTKCTAASDDDLQYVSTDDSSSDTFVDDNGLLSKSDDFSSDLLEDDSKDDELDRDSNSVPSRPTDQQHQQPVSTSSDKVPRETRSPAALPTTSSYSTENRPDIHTSNAISFSTSSFRAENLAAKDREPVTLDLSSKHREPMIKQTIESEEVSDSPLRHLETLSLGAFTGLNHTKSTFSHHMSTSSSTGISYHAPGLGLATSGSSDSLHREKSLRGPSSSEPQPLPMTMAGGGGLSMGTGDSDTDGQMQMLPMYRDASMMSGIDVPVDKENPRRCIACGKIFQNHFGVKTHYQNVHLKLMHKCTVEGCNAAFPSKRSRDRHSANLNLHRKLLSTSVDKAHYFEKGATIFPYAHPGTTPLRDDYFSRLYDPQSLSLNFADFYHGRLQEGFLPSSPFGGHLGIPGPLGMIPGFHPAFMVPPASTSNSSLNEGGTAISDGRDDTPLSSISSTPSPRLHSPSSPSSSGKDRPRGGRQPLSLESELVADGDGRYPCNFCQRVFGDSFHLKDHYESTHLPSLVPCPLDACHKVFLSKSDKDRHCSEEDHGMHRIKREPMDS